MLTPLFKGEGNQIFGKIEKGWGGIQEKNQGGTPKGGEENF